MLRVLRLDKADPLVWQKALLKAEVQSIQHDQRAYSARLRREPVCNILLSLDHRTKTHGHQFT